MNVPNSSGDDASGLPPAGFDNGTTTPFLSQGPPRSGEISTFAQKLLGECFVWLSSMVVFGSTLNLRTNEIPCNHLCGYAIATSVISVIVTSFLLFGHWLTWSSKLDRSSWFNSNTEKNFMGFLMVWWSFGVGGLSAVPMSMNTGSGKAMFAALNETLDNADTLRNFTKMATKTVQCKAWSEPLEVRHVSDVGIFFGWLAFFGSIYTTFKAFHTSKEEQRTLAFDSHPYSFAQGQAEAEDHYANF